MQYKPKDEEDRLFVLKLLYENGYFWHKSIDILPEDVKVGWSLSAWPCISIYENNGVCGCGEGYSTSVSLATFLTSLGIVLKTPKQNKIFIDET